MTITYEQLKKAAEFAAKLNKLRAANVLTDFMRSIKKYGSLTSRQESYAQKLLDQHNEQAVDEQNEAHLQWLKEWNNDPMLREKADIIASYYLTTVYYGNEATAVKQVLTGNKDAALLRGFAKGRVIRMIENNYAQNVWQSHTGDQKWKVGDMVAIRKTYKGNLSLGNKIETKAWLAQNNGRPMYDELSYVVVEVNSKPIDQAYTYDAKRGGCRYYRLLPVGVPAAVHIMECNLKKVLKKKVTK